MHSKYVDLLSDLWSKNRVHNGPEMDQCVDRLARFCKEHLRGKVIVHEFEPGTEYNHWIVPPHWSVDHFELVAPDGKVIAKAADHPLIVCPYSHSFEGTVTLAELKEHIVTRSDRPDAYSFYFRQMYRHWEPGWRITLPWNQVSRLAEGSYTVRLKTSRKPLPMKVFEYLLPGETEDTIFIPGHLDHPGMINDSLSGCLAALNIVDDLEARYAKTRYTYRVLLVPEIIGTAIYLKRYEDLLPHSTFAFCPNMTSHNAKLALCLSKRQDSLLDLAFQQALIAAGVEHVVAPFHMYPDCGDEISFDTVGYDIPSTTLSRIGEQFTLYHSSDDSFDNFLQADWQARHDKYIAACVTAFTYIEENKELTATFSGNPCLSNPALDLYLDPININNLVSHAEPLKDADGNQVDPRNFMEFFLDAINRPQPPSVLEIASFCGLPFEFIAGYAGKFAAKGLLKTAPTQRKRRVPIVGTTNIKVPELLSQR